MAGPFAHLSIAAVHVAPQGLQKQLMQDCSFHASSYLTNTSCEQSIQNCDGIVYRARDSQAL